MKITRFNHLVLIMINFAFATNVQAQKLESEAVLQQVTHLCQQLPASIQQAYDLRSEKQQQLDSLDQLMPMVYRALADKMRRRSARLNDMAGYNEQNAVLSLMPPNQKMTDFFLKQWDKMDALEKAYNTQVSGFPGKELYKKQGYLAVWDSLYKKRRQALLQYRDGVYKLVKAEIVYLKAHSNMFQSANEAERMQYVEEEVCVLQKMVLLKSKFKSMVIDDGAEKISFCIEHPDACVKKGQ